MTTSGHHADSATLIQFTNSHRHTVVTLRLEAIDNKQLDHRRDHKDVAKTNGGCMFLNIGTVPAPPTDKRTATT